MLRLAPRFDVEATFREFEIDDEREKEALRKFLMRETTVTRKQRIKMLGRVALLLLALAGLTYACCTWPHAAEIAGLVIVGLFVLIGAICMSPDYHGPY